MTPRNALVRSNKSSRNQGEDELKDEVYRQMFRLEERRPGAEMGSHSPCCAHGWLQAPNLKAVKSEIG
jgi:hypothetical protein